MCVKHLYRFKTSDFFLSVSWLGIPKNFCCSFHCRGTQHFTGTVSKEATSEMGYQAWPAGRTCNSIISIIRRCGTGLSREPQQQ